MVGSQPKEAVAIACWWPRYNLPGSWLLRAALGQKWPFAGSGGAPLGPEPVIRRIARRQFDSDPIETIRNLSPVSSLEPAIVRHCH
jgi:hypothetical protein